jgi:multisubunit Na+/H+ antiporter MnhG subunit
MNASAILAIVAMMALKPQGKAIVACFMLFVWPPPTTFRLSYATLNSGVGDARRMRVCQLASFSAR